MGNITSKGRKPLSSIEKAYKAWIRASESLAEVKAELDRMIATSDELRTFGRGLEVMDVVNERIDINMQLNKLIAELGYLVRIEEPTPSQLNEINKKKAQRSKLYDLLSELPELGATHKEWQDVPSEFKIKPLGRPRASIELRYIRMLNAFEQAEKHIKDEEGFNGVEPMTLEQAINKYGVGKQGAGRPSMTTLDKLDAEVKRVSLLLEAAQDELDNNPTILKSTFGRPSLSAQKKIDNYKERLAGLKDEVLAAESKLGNVGMIDRDLKAKRQKVRALVKSGSNVKGLKLLESEIDEITKYREFVKKADSGLNARKPYSLDYDRMVEFNKRYIVSNPNNRYVMD